MLTNKVTLEFGGHFETHPHFGPFDTVCVTGYGSLEALYITIVIILMFVVTASCGWNLFVDIFTHLVRNITACLNWNFQNNLKY